MKNQFIPHELSLELKKLGFDEPCLAFYNGKFLDSTQYDFDNCSMKDIGQCLLAPTYSQTFRWFRERHQLFGTINVDQTMEPKFCYSIVRYELNEWKTVVYNSDLFYTYEEAEVECMKEMVKSIGNTETSSYDPYCPVCSACGEEGCCSPMSCQQHPQGSYCKSYLNDLKFAYIMNSWFENTLLGELTQDQRETYYEEWENAYKIMYTKDKL